MGKMRNYLARWLYSRCMFLLIHVMKKPASLNSPAINQYDTPLRWRHNGHDSVSNPQLHHCLLNRLFGCRSKKTSKLPRHWPLCGELPGTGEFPAQMTSNAENVSIWWRHHDIELTLTQRCIKQDGRHIIQKKIHCLSESLYRNSQNYTYAESNHDTQ